MNNKLKIVLKGLAYIILIHVLVSLVVVFILINPRENNITENPEDYGLNYEEVEFKSRDGINLQGWFIESLSEDALATVVLMHGYPENKSSLIPEASYLIEDFDVFVFDFRALGDSEGNISTLGAKETEDLHGALDYIKGNKRNENIFLWGFSMGGGVALQVAPERDDVDAVVSDTSFSSMGKSVEDIFPVPVLRKTIKPFIGFWVDTLVKIDIEKVSPKKSAEKITIPVYLIHAKDDPHVSIEHGRRLEEALIENPGLTTNFIDGRATCPDISACGTAEQPVSEWLIEIAEEDA